MNFNFPNLLTLSRIFLTFVFVILASNAGNMVEEPTYAMMVLRWVGYICAIVAGLTDFADGYVARKWNQQSEFGALLDQLADKVFATATMVMLVELDFMAGWMAVIILSREFLVTGLRLLALKQQDRVIIADQWGKWKTALQMIAVFIAGLAWVGKFDIKTQVWEGMNLWMLWQSMLYVVVAVTLFSGIRYFYNNRDLFRVKE